MSESAKICAWCGVPIVVVTGRRQKYHPECAKKVATMRYYIKTGKEKFDHSYEAEQAKKAEEQRKLTMQWCGTCQYGMRFAESWMRCCNYMEMTGQRRPCPSVLAVGGPCKEYKALDGERNNRKAIVLKGNRGKRFRAKGGKAVPWKEQAEAAGKRETEQAERPEWAWFLEGLG